MSARGIHFGFLGLFMYLNRSIFYERTKTERGNAFIYILSTKNSHILIILIVLVKIAKNTKNVQYYSYYLRPFIFLFNSEKIEYNYCMAADLNTDLQTLFSAALSRLQLTATPALSFEKPAVSSHGDWSTPIALELFAALKASNTLPSELNSPRSLATKISDAAEQLLSKHKLPIASITVAGPGFINIKLTAEYFLSVARELCLPGKNARTAPKTADSVLIEYISPNTNKPLHIGHLRNAALGQALSNILESAGHRVHRAVNYNDRGLHIIKSEWAYLRFATIARVESTQEQALDTTNWRQVLTEWQATSSKWCTPAQMTDESLQKPDHFVGHWYQRADQFVGTTTVEAEWSEMLIAWEEESDPSHEAVRALWQQLNAFFYEGYGQTVARFGATFDSPYISYESLLYKAGKDVVVAAANKGTLTRLEDGAIKAELESVGLPDKVLLRKDGTGIYMTFDVELTRQRVESGIEQLIWVVGNDQKLYFQQLFAVSKLLGLSDSQNMFHFAYGMVRLPEGKMSSRKGLVVYADQVLDAAVERAGEIMQSGKSVTQFTPEEFAATAEAIGVGAVKWTMLSQDPLSEITFDLAESVSFKGFAGPYIQYTYARTQSIATKAKNRGITCEFDTLLDRLIQNKTELHELELSSLRSIAEYFDILKRTTEQRASHVLCTYLYELAQVYNHLYSELPVLPAEGTELSNEQQLRLLVTTATATVLADGLKLLTITPVERM